MRFTPTGGTATQETDEGTATEFTIFETGTYSVIVRSTGSVFISGDVVVSKIPLAILAFHYGNFDNVYGDGTVEAAADNGHIYDDTPTGTYLWGELQSASTASNQTTYTWTPPQTITADVLLVAGGGAGAGCWHGGGGGAGGLLYYSNQTLSGQKTIKVGDGGYQNGGLPGSWSNGFDTEFTDLTTVIGGGRGGTDCSKPGPGSNGGSGGGATGYSSGSGGSGTSGQGNSGGNGRSGRLPNGYNVGGGGGGAGGAGSHEDNGGHGGVGLDYSSVFGTTYGDSGWFAGGGAGGGFGQQAGGIGGNGGGGNGSSGTGNAQAGSPHTGGGGGGEGDRSGTRARGGGSGIVLLKFT